MDRSFAGSRAALIHSSSPIFHPARAAGFVRSEPVVPYRFARFRVPSSGTHVGPIDLSSCVRSIPVRAVRVRSPRTHVAQPIASCVRSRVVSVTADNDAQPRSHRFFFGQFFFFLDRFQHVPRGELATSSACTVASALVAPLAFLSAATKSNRKLRAKALEHRRCELENRRATTNSWRKR